MNDNSKTEPTPEPVSFDDLPKARQHRALCAWGESWRQMLNVQGGKRSSRQLRRAAASYARSQEGRRQKQLEKKAGQP